MGKTFIRIDDRLIHGQIAVAWAQTLSIGEIIAIDDATGNNPMLQQIMLMGISQAYRPKVVSFEKGKELLLKPVDYNRLVILKYPKDLPRILPYISKVEVLYLGNIQKNSNSLYNLSMGAGGVLFFSQEDIDVIEDLYQKGENIQLQMVPSSSSRTWEQAKKSFK